MNDDRWWESFFDETFAQAVLEDEAGFDAIAAQLVERLALRPGDRVLDQCCGLGRLSLPLAARGLAVEGVDLVGAYVARAAERARARGLPCVFHEADAFVFRPARPVRAVINWATSFGYARDDGRNLEMLRRACEALEPGGHLVLDHHAVPSLLQRFQPCMRAERGGVEVVRESAIDWARGLLEQRWRYRLPDGREQTRSGTTRLYLPHELGALLRAAGFGAVAFYGGADGRPFDRESPRMVAIAEKPSKPSPTQGAAR